MAHMRSQKRPTKRNRSRSGGKSKIHKASNRNPTYGKAKAGSTSSQMSHTRSL